MLTEAHAIVSLSSIKQKWNEFLYIYISRYSQLHYGMVDKTACENANPIQIYHFVASINNTTIADKIAKQVREDPKMLQKAFEKALMVEAGQQLAQGVHLGWSPQVMEIFADSHNSCSHDVHDGCIHQVQVMDSRACSNACQ